MMRTADNEDVEDGGLTSKMDIRIMDVAMMKMAITLVLLLVITSVMAVLMIK